MRYWKPQEAGALFRRYHAMCERLGYEPEDTKKTGTFTELEAAMVKYEEAPQAPEKLI